MYAYEHMRLHWNNGRPRIVRFWRVHVEPVPENGVRADNALNERQMADALAFTEARYETDTRGGAYRGHSAFYRPDDATGRPQMDRVNAYLARFGGAIDFDDAA